jgi:hypothetical protein
VKDSDQRNKNVPVATPTGTPGVANSEATKQATTIQADSGYRRTSVDNLLAEGLERYFSEVLDCVYFFSPAEIKRIDDRGEYLDLVFRMPFFLPEPSPDSGKWLQTRSAQTKLRRGFMNYLRKREVVKDLSDFFYTKLARFLLELGGISRYSDGVQKHLRRIAQKKLAGRPSHAIDKDIAKQIGKEGVEIHKTIQDMQRSIERWKKANPKIDDPAIKKNLFRSYPVKVYPWMRFFTSLIPKLPRKPYFSSKIGPSEVIGKDEKLPPAKLSEPDHWSRIDICAKVMQGKLLQDCGTRFSLRDIGAILRTAPN